MCVCLCRKDTPTRCLLFSTATFSWTFSAGACLNYLIHGVHLRVPTFIVVTAGYVLPCQRGNVLIAKGGGDDAMGGQLHLIGA